MVKKYNVMIINWEWQVSKTSPRKGGDRFYFSAHNHPRVKRFRTQKAAREWLESQGFTPLFPNAKRPVIYTSKMGGMQANIVVEDEPYGFWPAGSTEARLARKFR